MSYAFSRTIFFTASIIAPKQSIVAKSTFVTVSIEPVLYARCGQHCKLQLPDWGLVPGVEELLDLLDGLAPRLGHPGHGVHRPEDADAAVQPERTAGVHRADQVHEGLGHYEAEDETHTDDDGVGGGPYPDY